MVIRTKLDLKHFLRSTANRFTRNIYSDNDNTFRALQNLSRNKNIVILQCDKDSSVVLLPRSTYIDKLQSMNDEGISDGKYEPTSDTALSDLKTFQDFFYRSFKNNKYPLDYSEIRPSSNKPSSLFASAKTHKFDHLNQTNGENLTLRPIVSTCGTFYHKTAKALAKYLSPLAENEYTIKNTLDFADRLENTRSMMVIS